MGSRSAQAVLGLMLRRSGALLSASSVDVRSAAAVCLQQLRGHAGRVDTHYFNSVDPKEAQKFAALSRRWWDPAGPFAPLHRFNFARAKFIRDTVCAMHGLDHAAPEPLAGLRVLDVGCGGGILSESMARMGAEVHGIDITEENVNAATAHAELDPVVRDRIRFECVRLEALANRLGHPTLNSRGFKAGSEPTGDYIDPEDLTSTSNDPSPSTPEPASTSTSTGTQQAASATPQHYDVVLASEVIEHVKRPDLFCLTLGQLTAPGGTAIVSTLNRTPEAFGLAVVAAEYITGIVPRGTHDWNKFIMPEELYLMTKQAGLQLAHAAGIALSPLTRRFELTSDLGVNYIAAFHKPAQQQA